MLQYPTVLIGSPKNFRKKNRNLTELQSRSFVLYEMSIRFIFKQSHAFQDLCLDKECKERFSAKYCSEDVPITVLLRQLYVLSK